MEYTDRILKCMDCGAEFVFTAGEQLFFHDKEFKNDPKHCKRCKSKRVRGGTRVRPETRTNCAECGAETTVPFKPTQGRPVLCRSCFQKQHGRVGAEAESKPATEPKPAAEPIALAQPIAVAELIPAAEPKLAAEPIAQVQPMLAAEPMPGTD